MEERIKAMFFDVGRTLVDHNNNAVCERLAQMSKKSVCAVRLLLYGTEEDKALHTLDSLIYPFDAGTFGVERFFKTVRRRLGISSNVSNARIRDSFFHCFSFREGMEPLVKFLSANQFVLGITSNTNRLQWEHWCGAFPVLSPTSGVFDFYTLSFRERLTKPDQRFFETALTQASKTYERQSAKKLLPENCLVFDDETENIRAAKGLGLCGILVGDRGYRDIVRDLRRYHIAVDASIFEHA